MERKKILMLIPNLNFGGAQRVFYDSSVFLSQHYDVTECVFNFDFGHAFPTQNKVVSLDVPAGKNALDKLYRFVVRCVKYRKLKNQLNVDVSISHLEGANYVNLLSGGKSETIIVDHGSKLPHDERRTGIMRWLTLKILVPTLYKRAKTIVTVSEGIKKELISQFSLDQKKIVVIQNSFSTEDILSKSKEPLTPDQESMYSKKVVTTSGRLVSEKNHMTFLSVFAKVKRRASCCLLLAGDGKLKEQLINVAGELGLKTHEVEKNNFEPNADVYFLGYQSNPFKFISKASLFVLPSQREGFPLALCEAMICGAPVMTTDCRTGPREILAPNTKEQFENLNQAEHTQYGVLMPLLDNDAAIDCWANEIVRILADEKLQEHYGRAGRERMQDFEHEKVLRRWLDLIGDF